jgi:DNA-binding CsgD family transcriptional regulator
VSEPTPRQLAILSAWIELGDYRLVAGQLGLSVHTIRWSLGTTREALGARNSAQAFAIAVRRGLIDPHRLRIG